MIFYSCILFQQGAKKGAAVKWNNVATLIDDSDEPPNKKKRKN